MPTSPSSAFVPIETVRWTTPPAEGSRSSCFCRPTKNWCLTPSQQELNQKARHRHTAGRLVDLVDRARNREPEQQPDRPHRREVVQRDTEAAWDVSLRQELDTGAHRRGDDEAEEDQREHDL